MGNKIPTKSREALAARDGRQCVVCGGPGGHWHHRRGRAVRDEHSECPCNGITTCPTDHDWIHAHPAEAMRRGLIVSRHMHPRDFPFRGFYGWVFPRCDGTLTPTGNHPEGAP